MNDILEWLREPFAARTLLSLTLTAPRQRSDDACRKIEVRPVQIKGELRYQFACHQARKVTHRNLTGEEALTEIASLLPAQFRQAHLQTPTTDYDLLYNRRNEPRLTARPAAHAPLEPTHNRAKNYLLPEGEPHPFLVRLGVMTAEGRVIAARYDKFRQINRFLETVADVVEVFEAGKPLRVVDFGCGRAYLTFALYHYLRHVRQFEVTMTGLDLKADVIAECQQIAADLNYETLFFAVGDIRGYSRLDGVDMVVALHACDTATDDALVKAVGWGARAILAAPCCQHELFKQLDNDTMRPLLKHGILRERLSALITDALRAELLEQAGYQVQILEFIDAGHTPKNLLIRAVRRDVRPNLAALEADYARFRDFWRVQPCMERLLHTPPDP